MSARDRSGDRERERKRSRPPLADAHYEPNQAVWLAGAPATVRLETSTQVLLHIDGQEDMWVPKSDPRLAAEVTVCVVVYHDLRTEIATLVAPSRIATRRSFDIHASRLAASSGRGHDI